MRLLAVADLHYSLPQFDWVLEIAANFDVVVLAGDHLELASIVDRRAGRGGTEIFQSLARAQQARYLFRQPRSRCTQRDRREDRQMARRGADRGRLVRRRVVRDRRHAVHHLPWWDGPITRAGIAAQLAEAARQPHKQWISNHSGPPDQLPFSWGGARYFGDTELAQWIGGTSQTSCSAVTCISHRS